MKGTVLNIQNQKAGEVELSEEIFGTKVNRALLYETVKMQLANRREGTAATRNRALVSGTTAKMYRQKGTGRARHGDARANLFVGGGKAFGPKPRDFSYRIPAKARRGGVRAALVLKHQEGKLLIVDGLPVERGKTKDAVALLTRLGVTDGCIVVEGRDEKLERSVRNLPGITLLRWEGINAYDLVRHEHAVITVPALHRIQEAIIP